MQLYIRYDRHDLALKQMKLMKISDEDHVLTLLASAWTSLSPVGHYPHTFPRIQSKRTVSQLTRFQLPSLSSFLL